MKKFLLILSNNGSRIHGESVIYHNIILRLVYDTLKSKKFAK